MTAVGRLRLGSFTAPKLPVGVQERLARQWVPERPDMVVSGWAAFARAMTTAVAVVPGASGDRGGKREEQLDNRFGGRSNQAPDDVCLGNRHRQ